MLNAFYGSAMMIFGAVLIGTPIGVLAGIYLAEFARRSRLPGRLLQAADEVFVVATRKKVATMRQPARSEPRRDPATFEVPPRRHR